MAMQVIVEGLLTHYERVGKGRAVLIIPGWADTSASWQPLQQALSGTYDVIVLDVPGFGGSQQPDTAWDLDAYSRFIRDFLQKLSIRNLYAVIGHSNGGAIAIRALGTNHIRAEKLLLVASAGIRAAAGARKGVLRIVAKTGKTLARPLPKSVQNKLRARLYLSVGSDMLVAEHMQETFKKIVTDDVQDDATHIKVPALLIYGDKDTETPLRYGEMLRDLLPHARLEVIPGAGHFLHVDAGERLSGLVKGFLR